MDQLAALLDGPRARGAFTLTAVMAAPWGIEVRDEAPLAAVVVTRGSAVLTGVSDEAVDLRPGDLALVRGPAAYVVSDRADTPPGVIIMPGQRCVDLDGESLTEQMTLGVDAWGNSADGETTMLVGTYHGDGEVGRRLLEALPRSVVLRHGEWDDGVLALLGAELVRDRPGRSVVLDRLVDLLVVGAVRAWSEAGGRPGGGADPLVDSALRLLHGDHARAWTVASLAAEVGLSRAALARRFQRATGQPPMTYLTEWRLALAADLLRGSDRTVASVAAEVGYGSPFTFSAAFKRHFGRSPRHYADDTAGSGAA